MMSQMIFLIQKIEVPYESAEVISQEVLATDLETANVCLMNELKQTLHELSQEHLSPKLSKISDRLYQVDVEDVTSISFEIKEITIESDVESISLDIELDDFLI